MLSAEYAKYYLHKIQYFGDYEPSETVSEAHGPVTYLCRIVFVLPKQTDLDLDFAILLDKVKAGSCCTQKRFMYFNKQYFDQDN